jgi:tRNA pseudouridine32 synthase/23S rRNA pseudouridine746 synthase/23S rRNA pseudouridine1911/1915/1917 synthase
MSLKAADIQARLLYRDGLVLVIDKPAGIPVHAGPGSSSDNLERYFEHLRFGLPQSPALGHRLDRDTSGCLALGRQRKGLVRLGRLFQEGRAEKTYWAVTTNRPPQPTGTIDATLRKVSTRAGGWRMVVTDGSGEDPGQKAVTDYRVLGSGGGYHWIELKPRTGRTHQIRVHLAHIGCPILGEPQYLPPNSPKPVEKLHLHARELVLPLYPKKEPVHTIAAPPPHMLAALAACGHVPD